MTCQSYGIPDGGLGSLVQVKANQGAAGVDAEKIERFETKLAANLVQALESRMSSGSYFPPPVKLQCRRSQKKSGGVRVLGVPTVLRQDRADGGQDVARATA